MTSYTNSFAITARTAWQAWYETSDIACNYTERAIDWYLTAFFSEQAMQRYQDAGKILGVAMAITVAAGMTVRIIAQSWVDKQVAECLPADAEPEAEAVVEAEPNEIDPFDPAINPMPATVTVSAFESMNTPQLRKECQQRGIKWRNAHGKGKHLSKAEMLAALAA